ncbi:hypothetical protein OO009_02245 [Flavobacteriaceae bacterium KMM 6897]|nr:hypothetical protein [Flavobacteriaceae bacterium KMM 6897]
MKKVIFALVILTFSTFSLVSCRETKEKTIIIEKEAKEEKGILEKAGEKADKEVNEEIDKKIEEIGDDN